MISVLGSINLDLIAKTERLPARGETVTGTEFLTAAGGKGANQALAARRAGSHVSLSGAVGDDDFAAPATRLLREAGIDMAGVSVRPGATGIGLILVASDGANLIAVIPGANGTVSPAEAERVVGALKPGSILMLQLEIPLPTAAAALLAARKRGVRSVLNVAPFTPDAVGLARMADVVIANEVEFDGLTGRPTATDAEREDALMQMHDETGATVIVTLGANGAVGVAGRKCHRAPALAISPIDTVGAGDTFCGYFASAIDQGMSIPLALTRATVAGSLACLAPGAQTSIPGLQEVMQRLQSQAR